MRRGSLRMPFIVAVVCLALLAQRAVAQRYSFKIYTRDQGLRNLSINSLAQDSQGYLWVGTQSGVYRYDGNEFRAVGDRTTLPSLDVQSVAATSDGSIWLGTPRGLGVIRHGRVEKISTEPSFEIVGEAALAIGLDDAVYAGSRLGLLRITTANGVDRREWLSREAVSGVSSLPDGSVWFGLRQRRLPA